MPKTFAAGELARNARMVLRLLAKPEARLVEAGAAGWVIETGRSRRRSGHPVANDLVRELANRDLLIQEPAGGYRISVAGERWVLGGGATGHNETGCRENGFGDQHRLVRRPDKNSRRAAPAGPAVNETESPLGWLRSRRDKEGKPLISEAQFDAGERLRVDYTVAQMSPRVTLSWEACDTPGAGGRTGRRPDSLEVNERALAAKQRFMRAVDAVGPEMSGILVDVCCLSRGLEAAERSLGWPQRSGKLVLQIALTQLARHYGLTQPHTDSRRTASIRHWGVEDYRPQVGLAPGNGDGNGGQA